MTASRTLVKSPPELWSECSDAASLARHLDRFGEIRITRLEPETAVAWEGELASGTVRLEPSGWGTRVVLTATPVAATTPVPADPPAAATAPVPADPPGAVEPEPAAVVEPDPAAAGSAPPPRHAAADPPPRGLMSRLFGALRRRRPAPDATAAGPPLREPAALPAEPATTAAEPATPPREPAAPPPGPAAPLPPESASSAAPVAPEPAAPPAPDPLDALAAALDSLGQAHHRPFSRS
ncbi:MAG TPA: hypothetical protein VE992_02925 [Solirubrobacteraceae bacterium]|nr:hypothetical protein [Solirubrobacteraceae bacterium]